MRNGWLRFDAWIGTAGAALIGLGFVLAQPSLLLVGLVITAGAGVLAWIERSRAARLHDATVDFARAHGWEHLRSTTEYGGRLRAYPFSTGVRRRQESVLRGDFAGMRCATFAHVYEETSGQEGEQSVPIAHQVVMAELSVALPRLDIVPEGLGLPAMRLLGGSDVDVESHEFNRRWRVLAEDPRYAHAVLDARMIERLLAHDASGLMLRIEGGAVYTWQPGRQGVENLASRLGVVTGIARRIPQHVIRQYRELGYGIKDGFVESAPGWATQPGALISRQPTELAQAAGWMPPVGPGPSVLPAAAGRAEPLSPARASAAGASAPAPTGPAWAAEPGALTGRRYTGVGVDADGDGIEDWRQLNGDRDGGRH